MSNNLHKCSVCEKFFTSLKLLEEHQTQEHSKSFHSCSVCGREFTNPDHLEGHTDAHRRNSHCCKFCGEVCNDEADIYIHLTTVHDNIDKDSCGVCKKEFKKLKRHIKTAHFRKCPSMIDNIRLFCSVHSPQLSFDDDELKNELKRTDMSQIYSETQSDKLSETETFRNTKYLEKSELGYRSKTPEYHPNPGGIQTSSTVEKMFGNPWILRNHEEAHARSYHCCQFCGKIFNEPIDLYIDLTTAHKNVKKFVCVLCNSELSSKGNLKMHIPMVHTSIVPLIINTTELFCTRHSTQKYIDDRELQNETPVLNISQTFSETQEDDVSGDNFYYTGHNEKISLGYDPGNPEYYPQGLISAKETEMANVTEQKQEMAAPNWNSINQDCSGVQSNPLSELRIPLPSAENNAPNSDWTSTSAVIEHPMTFKNTFGMEDQIEKQEANAIPEEWLSPFNSTPYSKESLAACYICGMKFSDLGDLTLHLLSLHG